MLYSTVHNLNRGDCKDSNSQWMLYISIAKCAVTKPYWMPNDKLEAV